MKAHLDRVYHAIQSTLEQYDFYAATMRDLKESYLEAALRRFLSSPEAVQSEYEFEKIKENAKTMLNDPDAPGMSLPSRLVQQTLARPTREDAPDISVAVRRMRREHTL